VRGGRFASIGGVEPLLRRPTTQFSTTKHMSTDRGNETTSVAGANGNVFCGTAEANGFVDYTTSN
jgi:hypothetical protein